MIDSLCELVSRGPPVAVALAAAGFLSQCSHLQVPPEIQVSGRTTANLAPLSTLICTIGTSLALADGLFPMSVEPHPLVGASPSLGGLQGIC